MLINQCPTASNAGAGGVGTVNSITGSCVTYAGGGGGGKRTTPGCAGAGGTGGGGAGGQGPAVSICRSRRLLILAAVVAAVEKNRLDVAELVDQESLLVKELNKASGMWSMQSQFQNQEAGTWPKFTAPVTFDFLVVAGGGAGTINQGSGGGSRRLFNFLW